MDVEQRRERSRTLWLVHHGEPGLIAVATVLDILHLEVEAPCRVIVEHCHDHASSAVSVIAPTAQPIAIHACRICPIMAPNTGSVKGAIRACLARCECG